ncbi:SusD/RagB family nutrient-binding outer membrane lipoprotein [Sphingobacterium sp. Mn56C]|uniref:SusD/RagB family nutrient-binding outer membrane lipoprotein n=1 Tax=Sphingobacterium sp. Mn56C TaxID=3395261 RepID=UPI003BD3E25F
MKITYLKIKTSFCLLVMGLTIQSCTMDINVNPNRPTASSSEFLLPPALLKLATYESVTLNELGAFFAGYWGKANDVSIGGGGATLSYLDMIVNYSISDVFANSVWENAYSNIYNIKRMEDKEEHVNPAYAGICKILRAWYFLRLVDHYNNVPFFEASDPDNRTPRYDQGERVYQEAVKLISSGIALLQDVPQGSKIPSTDDILFKGDLTLWRKLGNTVKLRALIRQSEVAVPAYIQKEILVILKEGSGFLTEDALLNPGFTTNAGQMNSFWTAFYRTTNDNIVSNYNGYRPTQYLLAQYKAVNDPRMAQNYVAIAGDFKGVVLGSGNDASQNFAVTSAFKGPKENNNQDGGLFKSPTQGLLLLAASESYFLQAEAAQRGWLAGHSAADLYSKAIKASFRYIGLSADKALEFLAQNSVDLAQAPNKIERIVRQKWLALNGIDGAEAWADYRRLGIPDAPGSLLVDATGKTHPIRLRYPTSEVNNNAQQVREQGDIVGTDRAFRVFWQK